MGCNYKIFDSLTHITKDSKWYGTQHDASLERLLKGFECGLAKALLVGMPKDDIDYLLSIAWKYADKLIPIAPLEFSEETTSEHLEMAIRTYKQKGFRGIKIHPRFLNTNLTDKKIIDAIRISGKYGLVSLLCTVHKAPSKPLKRPVYDVIHEICDETQGSRLILLHGGFYDILATSEIVRYYNDTLLDLSATIMRFKESSIMHDIKFLFQTFDQRLCIGSDFPEYTVHDIISVLENYSLQTIDPHKLHNILFNNLEQFFGSGNEQF